jgi:hypothetical protein
MPDFSVESKTSGISSLVLHLRCLNTISSANDSLN